jgi:glucose-1-phosphate thymidylyltransferase
MKCLILAGGFATRLYPLTANKAKALIEYRGKPVITHLVERIPHSLEIMVSTNSKFEADFLLWNKSLKRPVEICIEEALNDDQKMGSIGAMDYWIRHKRISEDLLVMAADNYFEFDLNALVARFNKRNPLIAVHDVGDKDKACEVSRACQVGLVTLNEDRVVRLDEKPPEATSSIISTGIYLLPTRIFPRLAQYCAEGKRDNMGSFINFLLNEGEEVQAFVFSEPWIDIGEEIKKGNLSV